MSEATLERSSWAIKDQAIVSELVTLMNLSEQETAALAAARPEAERLAPEMTKVFYDRLLAHQNTREYLESVNLDRLHSMTGNWFTELFSGSYDEEYARKRLAIGEIHVRIGLPVRYPLAMIDVITEFGELAAATATDPELTAAAFRKVLALDVAVFNQAYEDNQLQHLAELVGGERLARLLLSGTQ